MYYADPVLFTHIINEIFETIHVLISVCIVGVGGPSYCVLCSSTTDIDNVCLTYSF